MSSLRKSTRPSKGNPSRGPEADLAELFRADCELRNIGGTKIYVLYARKFSEFLAARGKSPSDVAKEDLRDYLASLRKRRLKEDSIDRIFTCLSQFYAFLVDEELMVANPITPFRRRYLRRYKNERASEPRQITSVAQISKLVNSVLGSRDKAILMLLFKTGMRCGELCRLDVSDIDMARMEIRLKPTAKRSNRLLFFDDETAEVLRVWLKVRAGRKKSDVALFPSSISSRISPAEVNFVVKKHAARVGLHNPESKRLGERFTPHCCRHFFTTHLIRAGMPRDYVKELRGDVRREAIDIYNHIDVDDLKRSYMAHIPQFGI